MSDCAVFYPTNDFQSFKKYSKYDFEYCCEICKHNDAIEFRHLLKFKEYRKFRDGCYICANCNEIYDCKIKKFHKRIMEKKAQQTTDSDSDSICSDDSVTNAKSYDKYIVDDYAPDSAYNVKKDFNFERQMLVKKINEDYKTNGAESVYNYNVAYADSSNTNSDLFVITFEINTIRETRFGQITIPYYELPEKFWMKKCRVTNAHAVQNFKKDKPLVNVKGGFFSRHNQENNGTENTKYENLTFCWHCSIILPTDYDGDLCNVCDQLVDSV